MFSYCSDGKLLYHAPARSGVCSAVDYILSNTEYLLQKHVSYLNGTRCILQSLRKKQQFSLPKLLTYMNVFLINALYKRLMLVL